MVAAEAVEAVVVAEETAATVETAVAVVVADLVSVAVQADPGLPLLRAVFLPMAAAPHDHSAAAATTPVALPFPTAPAQASVLVLQEVFCSEVR